MLPLGGCKIHIFKDRYAFRAMLSIDSKSQHKGGFPVMAETARRLAASTH